VCCCCCCCCCCILLLCVLCCVVQSGWPELSPGVGSWVVQVVRFIILLAQAVPISLYVSLETVKVAQCKVSGGDWVCVYVYWTRSFSSFCPQAYSCVCVCGWVGGGGLERRGSGGVGPDNTRLCVFCVHSEFMHHLHWLATFCASCSARSLRSSHLT